MVVAISEMLLLSFNKRPGRSRRRYAAGRVADFQECQQQRCSAVPGLNVVGEGSSMDGSTEVKSEDTWAGAEVP